VLSRRREQVCVVTLAVCVWCLCGCNPVGIVTLNIRITGADTVNPAADSRIALVHRSLFRRAEKSPRTDLGTTDADGKITLQYGALLNPIALTPLSSPLHLLIDDGREEEIITFTIRDSVVEGEMFDLQVLSVKTERPGERKREP
jgi:hypothetical protein